MTTQVTAYSPYTFIDLFAGIGGIRIAFEEAGCRCLFSCELDKFCQETYKANYGEVTHEDIRTLRGDDIPDHDILTAGFPCQPFSLSGVSKRNSLGLPHGFRDPTQGTLFFELQRIIGEKRPKAFLLENVKHLVRHDGGNTYRLIMETLEQKLEYNVHAQTINADSYVPQHRERIFIVGFRKDLNNPAFMFPSGDHKAKPRFRDILVADVDEKYTLSDHLWSYLQEYAAKHRRRGNGFGYGLVDLDGKSRTLSARYHKDGSEILVPQLGKNPRRLTPRECANLMGFTQFRPDFKVPVSDTQAYRQFGNSVVVPLVHAIAVAMVESLNSATRGRVTVFAGDENAPVPLKPGQLPHLSGEN